MTKYRTKYYVLKDGKATPVSPSEYIVRFYCGNIHWINVNSGLEEIIYVQDMGFTYKTNPMQVETKLFIRNEDTGVTDFVSFTFSLKDVVAYYYATPKSTIILLNTLGEFEIMLTYDKLKSLKEIDYSHETLLHFN